MATVDTQREEPSARTVSALLDAATERIGDAAVEDARTDAELIVADALGVRPEDLRVDSADELSAALAAAIEEKVSRRADRGERGKVPPPRRPRADRLRARPRPLPQPRNRRRRARAVAAARDRA